MKLNFGGRTKPRVVGVFFGLFSFCLSYVFLPLAVEGDQLFYREYYSGVGTMSMFDAYVYFGATLDSLEPGYFLITYAASHFLGKDILMTVLNGLLGCSLGYWLSKERVSIVVILLLTMNFYLMVLFFSAERLKVAMLFFLLSIVLTGRLKGVFSLLSVSSHVQLALLYFSLMMVRFNHRLKRFVFFGKIPRVSLSTLFLMIVFVFTVLFMQGHIEHKIMAYMRESLNLDGIWKPLFFAILTIYYVRGSLWGAVMQHFIIIVAALFIGQERLVIFSYIVFMSYGVKVNKGLNVGVLISSAYFFQKGLVFLYNTQVYGDGFKAAVTG